MGKKTEPEEDRIFKPPESPHFQTAADTEYMRVGQPDYGPLESECKRLSGGETLIQKGIILGRAAVEMKA
jgi:hypothetical protein